MNKPKVKLISFGFKYGKPFANFIFDVSFLKNPKFKDEWSENIWHLTPDMRAYVTQQTAAKEFVEVAVPFIRTVALQTDCVVGIGCTGGHHRSVTMTDWIAEALRMYNYEVIVEHRDAHD